MVYFLQNIQQIVIKNEETVQILQLLTYISSADYTLACSECVSLHCPTTDCAHTFPYKFETRS